MTKKQFEELFKTLKGIEEALVNLKEAEIDAAFARMATDMDYQRDAISLTREFETSDRDALEVAERAQA